MQNIDKLEFFWEVIIIENSHLNGIGGWLMLVLFGLIISLIMVGLALSGTMELYQPETWHAITTYGSEIYHPLFGTWIIYETFINVFIIVFTICLLVLMLNKSRFFPKLMIFYFASAILLQGIDYYLSFIVLTGLPNLEENPSIDTVIRSLVQAAVWIPYFMKSKRVKITFLSNNQDINLDNSIEKNL